jgi:hypothetical protein
MLDTVTATGCRHEVRIQRIFHLHNILPKRALTGLVVDSASSTKADVLRTRNNSATMAVKRDGLLCFAIMLKDKTNDFGQERVNRQRRGASDYQTDNYSAREKRGLLLSKTNFC